VFPDSLGISLSVDALVMVLLGGVETVSARWSAPSPTSAQHLAGEPDRFVQAGARRIIVLIVVGFPKGIVGMLETIGNRRRPELPKPLAPGSRAPNECRPTLLSVEGLTNPTAASMRCARDVRASCR